MPCSGWRVDRSDEAPLGCLSPAGAEWVGWDTTGPGWPAGDPAALRRSPGGLKSAIVSKTFYSFHPHEGGTWREASESSPLRQVRAGSRLDAGRGPN